MQRDAAAPVFGALVAAGAGRVYATVFGASTRPGTSAFRRHRLTLLRLEFLQRLRAADGHLLLVGFEAFQNPPAAGFDAFAEPLHIAHAIGPDMLERQTRRSSRR